METRMFETQIACPPDGDGLGRTVVAFDSMAATPSLSLLHHYETRLNLTCQRSLRTLIMLRTVKFPNDPSPISEHFPPAEEPPPPPQQATDFEPASSHIPARPPAAPVGQNIAFRQRWFHLPPSTLLNQPLMRPNPQLVILELHPTLILEKPWQSK
jgi:hypothetical protein